MKCALAVALVLGLTACAGAPKKGASPPSAAADRDGAARTSAKPRKKSPYPPAQADPSKRGNYTAGGLYAPGIDDTAPDVEIDVSLIPEPQVVAEPLSRYGNPDSYTVLGEEYFVLDSAEGYVDTGMASYYGTKFHGRHTSNMEVYDMYAFTAAHKTLPLPSFARVTNLENGKSVVVRVNDRGPFHDGRIVDLSYAAALKLGVVQSGTARVRVRALTPGDTGDAPAVAEATERAPTLAAASASSLDKLVATLPLASAAAIDLPPGVHIATGQPTRLDGKAAQPAVGSYAPVRPAKTGAGPTAAVAGTATAAAPDASDATAADGVTLQVASFAARGNADRALATLRQAGIEGARLLGAQADGQHVWRLRVGPLAAEAVASLAARIAGLGFGEPQPVHD